MATLEILATDQATSAPLAGADVGVFLMEREPATPGRGSRPLFRGGTTDETGLCSMRVELVPGERVRVLAFVRARGHEEWRGPGLGRRSPDERTRDDAPTLADGETLRLAASLERGLTLRGSVTDAALRPVAGAHIGLVLSAPTACTWPHAMSLGRDAHWPPPVVTDERGAFEWLSFPLRIVRADPSFHYVLLVHHEDFASAMVHRVETRPADDAGVIHLEVGLEAGTTLSGRVVGADGTPSRGAAVTVTATPRPDQPVCVRIERRASTDDDGRFRLRGLWNTSHEVKVEASGTAPWTGGVDLAAGPMAMPDVGLVGGADLAGRVVDRDGSPLSDIDVYASMHDLGVFRRTRSDADGRFRLVGLPLTGRVEVRSSLFTSVEIDLPSPPLTLRAPATSELRVALVADEDGAPIVGRAVVSVLGPVFSTSLLSDPTGAFAPRSLPVGRYTLRAEIPDRAPTSTVFELPERGTYEPFVIRVPRGGVVRGHVRDADGVALEGVHFVRMGDRHGRYPATKTDGTGAYEARGLGTRACLVFTRPGFAVHAIVLGDTGTAEAPIIKDVTMGAGATVTGRVTRGDGSPSVGANVKVSHPDLRLVPYELPATLTDVDGRFALKHVPPGDYLVTSGAARTSIRSAHGAAIEVALSTG